MTTEVILRKDVVGLGEEGDIKKVAGGYARNYLLPFGFAALKTQSNLKKLEKERESIKKRKEEKLEMSKGSLEKINGLTITFEENASENGKLFGSISQGDIFNSIKDKGFDIDKRQVILSHPIKAIGSYQVDVRFYGNLVANVNVLVNQKEK